LRFDNSLSLQWRSFLFFFTFGFFDGEIGVLVAFVVPHGFADGDEKMMIGGNGVLGKCPAKIGWIQLLRDISYSFYS
jgi:hypothetical protein